MKKRLNRTLVFIIGLGFAQALGAAESYEPYYKNAITFSKSGDYQTALSWVDRGMQVSPDASDLLVAKAYILELAKRPGVGYFAKKALDAKSFKLETRVRALDLQSRALLRESYAQEAIDLILSNMTASEVLNSSDITLTLVKALEILDEDKKALSFLEKAIELNPYNLKLYAAKIEKFGFSSLDSSYLRNRARQDDPDYVAFGISYATLLPASNEKTSLVADLLKLSPKNQMLLFLAFESTYQTSTNKAELISKLSNDLGSQISGEILELIKQTLAPEDLNQFVLSITPKLISVHYDKNGDGWIDRQVTFEKGQVAQVFQDTDYDGIFESQLSFANNTVTNFEFFDKLSGLWYFASYKGLFPYAMVDSIQSKNEVVSFVHPYRKNEDPIINLPAEPLSLANAIDLAFDHRFLLNLESILTESSECTVATNAVLQSHYLKPFASGLELDVKDSVVTESMPKRGQLNSLKPIAHYTLSQGLLRAGRLDEDANGLVDHYVEYDAQGLLLRGFRDPSGNANHWVIETYSKGKLREIQAISDSYSYSLNLDKMIAVWDLNKDGKIDIKEMNLGKKSLEQVFSSRGNGIPDLLIRPNQ